MRLAEPNAYTPGDRDRLPVPGDDLPPRIREATFVSSIDELRLIVAAVKKAGVFAFDVETRGFIRRHSDIMAIIDAEWEEKKESLKTTSDLVLSRSRQSLEDKWTSDLALDTTRNEVFWLGLATSGGRTWAIPMGHPNGEVIVPEERGDGSTVPPPGYRRILASGKESMAKAKYVIPAQFSPPPQQLSQGEVFDELEAIFMDPDIVKVGHNVKFDARSVAKYYNGQLPAGRYVDTMCLQHVLDENLMSYGLEGLINGNFKHNPYLAEGKVNKSLQIEPFSKVCRYVHYDARWTWLLYSRLMRKVHHDPGLAAAAQLDSEVVGVLAQMELNGIGVSERQMRKLGKELEEELNAVLLDLYEYAPVGFNPDSTLDKKSFLFGKKSEGGLGFTPTHTTPKGEPSVDKVALKKLEGKHPAVDLIARWQELKKLKSTYVDGMYSKLRDGKLHPSFHLHRTDTGRLSSSDPNLQNIPRDGKVRSLFRAEEGHRLIVADYDQIELRVMAMFSRDQNLCDIFVNDSKDIHTATACLVLGREYGPDSVTPDERVKYGKMPNFLMAYGGSPFLLSEKIGVSMEEAEDIHTGYVKAYEQMFLWKNAVIRKAHRIGYVKTALGRQRRLGDDLLSDVAKDRFRAERQAVNFVVQGTAAEICKQAMVRLHGALPPRCKMLVQVHDELVVSVPEDEVDTWLPVVEENMGNGSVMMDIPLKVTGKAALSWYDAK